MRFKKQTKDCSVDVVTSLGSPGKQSQQDKRREIRVALRELAQVITDPERPRDLPPVAGGQGEPDV